MTKTDFINILVGFLILFINMVWIIYRKKEVNVSTSIRSEISEKNEYYIPKEKYLELKYFCLQYPEWKKACSNLLQIPENHGFLDAVLGGSPEFSDPTGATACMLAEYAEKIQLVRKTAEEAEPTLANYIILAVTKGLAYPALYSQYHIPCGRDMFYNRYRKFFWLLAQKRK